MLLCICIEHSASNQVYVYIYCTVLYCMYVHQSGAYAAFLAGGCTLSLSEPYVNSPSKYISLYNTEGAPFSTEKRNIFLCN